jgi:hypothetical protein
MKLARPQAPQRRIFVIQKVVLAGLFQRLIVEEWKCIKDWKDGFCDRLRKESMILEELGTQSKCKMYQFPEQLCFGALLQHRILFV